MSVYIIQNHAIVDDVLSTLRPKYDFRPAEKFGDLVFLLSPIAVPNNPRETIAKLQKKLSNFTDADYLLLVGNPCFIGWASTVAAASNEGRVKMLQWNGRRKRYYEIKARGLI